TRLHLGPPHQASGQSHRLGRTLCVGQGLAGRRKGSGPGARLGAELSNLATVCSMVEAAAGRPFPSFPPGAKKRLGSIPLHGRLKTPRAGARSPGALEFGHPSGEEEQGRTSMAQRPILDETTVALTFDDVLLAPRPSDVLPSEVDVSSRVTREIG